MQSTQPIIGRLIRLVFLLAAVGIVSNPVLAQDPVEQPDGELSALESFIDGYVMAKMVDMDPPGMSVAVVTPQGTITRGYGIANMDTGEVVTPDTLFRIGSISKLFVWLSAHMLADEGRLDLDADVNTYFDGFAIPEAYGEPVTMRDLMAHRPGFEDNVRDFIDPNRNLSLKEAVSRDIPARVAPPGERASYSNSGTNIAAYVVERVAGEDYYEFVRRRILGPAGLTSTSLRDPGTDQNPVELDERMAVPHAVEKGAAVAKRYMPIRPQEPVGAVAMSARDAVTFMQLLLNGTQLESGERLLSEEGWARVATPAFPDATGSDDMGWGFMLNDVDGAATIGHGGATKFLSWLFVVPEQGVGVFVSSNMDTSGSRGEDVAWSIVRRLAGTNPLSAFQAREGDVDAANEVAGTYLNNRRQFYGVPALFGLGSETKVTADDGFVVLGSSNRYAPLGNDVWVALNGSRLRVDRADDGSIERLHGGLGSATYERVTFWESTRPLVYAIGASGFLSITTLLGMWYRLKRTNSTTATGRRVMWVALVSALLWLVFLGGLGGSFAALSNLDFAVLDETGMPLSLSLALATLVALAIQAVIHVVTLYWAWIGSGWSLWRRIHYTAFGIVFAFAMLGLGQLGVIGASVYGS